LLDPCLIHGHLAPVADRLRMASLARSQRSSPRRGETVSIEVQLRGVPPPATRAHCSSGLRRVPAALATTAPPTGSTEPCRGAPNWDSITVLNHHAKLSP